MQLDAPVDVRGLQLPPIESLPEIHSSAGDEAVELAAHAGLVLDPWQQYVLKGALGERQDGKWAAFEVAVIVSRQNGKGSITEARELAGLYLFNERLLLHSAHEFKTSTEAFLRVKFLIENTPDLDRRVMRIRTSHGEEGIELKGGQRLRFIARSRSSGRGFSGDCIILDEAMILGNEAMGALLPTLSARPNPQVWYTSSAGTAESTQLARVVRRGRAGGDPSLAYFEWKADDDDPHDSEEAWAKANPALGIRITQEHVRLELAALDFTEFARERLGIGTYPSEHGQEWVVIDETTWLTATDLKSEMSDPIAFAIDVSPDRSFSSIAAAGSRHDGYKHVEIVDHAPGTGWVVERMDQLKGRWNPKAIALDPAGPAGSLIPDLQAVGIEPLEIGTRDLAHACGNFYDSLMAKPAKLRHRGQPQLTAAVKGAMKRTLGDSWAWSRRDSTIDISPLVAATLALHAHGAKTEETESEVWFMN